jgi:hypothetical protein
MHTETLSSNVRQYKGNMFPGGGMYLQPEADKHNYRRFFLRIDDDDQGRGYSSQVHRLT